MDDILSNTPQAREEVVIATIEAGLMPNTIYRPLHGIEDVDALYAECRALGEGGIFICRVSREAALRGMSAGASFGLLIANMPANVRGRVLLAFDGWADDPRGMWQIPEAVAFCNGLIYGSDPVSNPNPLVSVMARAVLPFLVDEARMAQLMGREAWNLPGRNWVISVAHPAVMYRGNMRDVGLATNLYNVLMGALDDI